MGDEEKLPLLGGTLCLDFANTVDWRGTERARDRLGSYEALIGWALHAGAIDQRAARRLAVPARPESKQAANALVQARDLREAIYDVASAAAAGRAPARRALTAVNEAIFPLIGSSRLASASGELRPVWAGDPATPERMLWPVAWSAFELFTGAELDRLRECAHEDCHWLFIDRSRNRSRRWCAMWNCGNLTKARRFRIRHQS